MMISRNNDIGMLMEASTEAIVLSLFVYIAIIASITLTTYMFWNTYFSASSLIIKLSTYFVLILLIYVVLTEMYDLANNLLKIKLFSETLYMNLEYLLIPLSIILSIDLVTDITANIYREYKIIIMIIDITLILVESALLYLLGRRIVLGLDLRKLIRRLYGSIYGLTHSFWRKIKRREVFTDASYLISFVLLYNYAILFFQVIRVISIATGRITINSILNCLVLIMMIKLVLYSSTISYMMYTGIILSPEQKIDLRKVLVALNRRQSLITTIYYKSIKELEMYIHEVLLNPLNDVIIILPYNINTECARFIREIKNNNTAVIIYLRKQTIALQKLPISSERKIFYISSPQFMQINYIIRDVRFTAPTLRIIICLMQDESLIEKMGIMFYRFVRGIIDYFCGAKFTRVFIEFTAPYNRSDSISELLSLIVHDEYTLSKQ